MLNLGSQNGKIKKNESQTQTYFSAGGEKNKKRDSTTALYRAQTKVLQRYIVPPQDIVVYLNSPCRRREQIVCAAFLQGHASKALGS